MSQMPYPYSSNQPVRKRRSKLFLALLLVLVLGLAWAGLAAWRVLDEEGIFSGPRLGLVTVEGFIGDAAETVSWIEKLRKNQSVAGVLVRIDSPGGAVAPSQEVYTAVKRLAGAKPVVVSMGSIAASGGYYAAVAGKTIFANPSTLTGSIGVRLQVTNLQHLMERIGVASESLTTGKFKASGSPFKELTAEERAYLQGLLDDMRDQFVDAIVAGRGLSKDSVRSLADGRVLTGRQALEAGLVDQLGDREEALKHLAGLCKIAGEAEILAEPEKTPPWWKRLLQAAFAISLDNVAEPVQYRFVY